MFFVGESNSISMDEVRELFNRHEPLFRADLGGGVRPALFAPECRETIQHTFDRFYQWNALYDMVRQWIVEDGPFVYDFSWLKRDASEAEFKKWIDGVFLAGY